MLNYQVFKIKAFRNLWFSQLISISGDAFYLWLCLYMVDKITHSAIDVAVMGLVSTVPVLIFGSHAGLLADKFDRKKIMLASDLLNAAVLVTFGLITFGMTNPPLLWIYAAKFIQCTLFTFFLPARSASLPMIVHKENLIEANGISSATQNMGPLIGMGVFGGILSIIQQLFPNMFFTVALFMNASTFLGSAFFVSRLPSLLPDKRLRESVEEDRNQGKIVEGFRYILHTKALKVFLLIEALSYASVALYIPAYLMINRIWFGGEYLTLTILEFTQALALVLGSLWVAKLKFKKPSTPYLMATFILALGFCGMGVSPIFWLFAIGNMIIGFGMPFLDVPLNAYVQASTPNHFLGRVSSIQSMLTYGMIPVGIMVFGPLLGKFGPGPTLVAMGGVRVIGGLIGLLHKGFREEVMPA
jgi:DHA3 family macrolide efflux protein-like MFS transporter